MKTYIGCKLIEAEPMTRGEYNKLRGWTLPLDENPNDDGYLVKYSDEYLSWSPKGVFEKHYFNLYSDKQHLLESLDFIDERDYEKFRGKDFKKKIDPIHTEIGCLLGGTYEISNTIVGSDEWKEKVMYQEYLLRHILDALLTFAIVGFKEEK